MSDPDRVLKMDIHENAVDSIRRSLWHAQGGMDHGDDREWKFALLSAVHGVELMLKAALSRINPSLLHEDIDAPTEARGNTVRPMVALGRLKRFSKIDFISKDERYIDDAIKLRNQVMHSTVHLQVLQTQAQFFHLMVWLNDFHERAFGRPLSNEHMDSAWKVVLNYENYIKGMMARIQERVKKSEIKAADVRKCKRCGKEAYVLGQAFDACFLCGNLDMVAECDKCHRLDFAEDLYEIDFGDMKRREDLQNRCRDCYLKMRQGAEYYGDVRYVPEEWSYEEDELDFGEPDPDAP